MPVAATPSGKYHGSPEPKTGTPRVNTAALSGPAAGDPRGAVVVGAAGTPRGPAGLPDNWSLAAPTSPRRAPPGVEAGGRRRPRWPTARQGTAPPRTTRPPTAA